ncbi:Cytochrome P450 monooxygenase mpaDE [Vanrija pseudolonga]|uniref:Cytochrome P450 monooxygenase mpaDE n=1 Tax=Vanrija pseudolonga TaxID=143232 RepID=A0AAF0YJH1_9TREE|nr:Cytochrome P450 monooxygenase mpaDE [Vanrija pseudolonga]
MATTITDAMASAYALGALCRPPTSSVRFMPLPSPSTACTVRAIRAGSLTQPLGIFLSGGGAQPTRIPVFTFLVEHPSGRRILYDLGVKADLDDYAPALRREFGSWVQVTPPRAPLPAVLEAHGVQPASVEAVVLSHAHFDHVGDIGLFPASVGVLLGPGVKADRLPGFPHNACSHVNDADLPARAREVDPADVVDIGAFRGVDYFGDGSFWVLSAEGHTPGHLAALVRTSADSWLLLGGDAAHMRALYSCCRGTAPVHTVGVFTPPDGDAPATLHADLETAYATMAAVARMEEEHDVCVFLSHDREWEAVLDAAVGTGWEVADASGWRARGWKEAVEAARRHV